MASWKKVIVSGSAAELGSLTLDTALAIAQGGTGAITAQASIDALTAVAGASAGQVLTKDDSGNATFQDAATSFTAAGISGSFTAASSSFSTRVTLNDAKLTANTTNVTNAGALMDSEVTNLALVKGLTAGIADTNVLISDGTISDDDFLRISGTAVEGRNATEIKSDLSLNNVTNESKTTMFTSPAFTGLATAASLTISGDLNVAGSASFNH